MSDTRQQTSVESLLECLSEASRIATVAGDAATLVKCAEVYLDLAKLLGEKREDRPKGLPARVAAGLKAEVEGSSTC